MDENVISTRVSEYLRHLLDVILFDEFSQNYLSQADLADVMSEIPVPFQVQDLVKYKEEGSLPVDAIILNMGRVIGADSEFIYNENYKQFIRHFLGEKAVVFFAVKAADEIAGQARNDAEEEGLDSRLRGNDAGVKGYDAEEQGLDSRLRGNDTDIQGDGTDMPNDTNIVIPAEAGISDTDNLELACAYQRAAVSLCAEPDAEILYAYADICTRLYNLSEDPDYTGSFKAEAIDIYETLTFIVPDFAPAWYQLGYAYANMGLYAKAVLTWQSFLELTSEIAGQARNDANWDGSNDANWNGEDASGDGEDTSSVRDGVIAAGACPGLRPGEPQSLPFDAERKEIEDRIAQMDAPMRIEKGCNEILAGRYQSGIDILEEFTKGEHEAWWPLWYYLGEAYMAVGQIADSEASFKRVLTLSPSQIQAMEGLVEIYEYTGDEKLREKYTNKIKVIKDQE
jgi:tetratricopeptide (TPR) repeat protein